MKLFFTLLLSNFFLFSFAQKTASTYPLVVSFHSICCGVPDDAPITTYISGFKKTYKVKKIAYDRIGPLGKEGEYNMAFPLTELSKKQKAAFIKNIKLIVPKMKDQGSASAKENEEIQTTFSPRVQKEDYSFN